MNYYVLQVAPREEEKAEAHIRKMVSSGLYDRCFHPMRLIRKKIHGRWIDVHEKLIPGYIFVTAENAEILFVELKKIPLLTKLLGGDLEHFTRLSEQEKRWLNLLMFHGGDDNSEIGLSQIDVREGNEIRIISGPLMNMEGMVKRINLHKMIAEVEVPFMNDSTVIHLGIEMVETKGKWRIDKV